MLAQDRVAAAEVVLAGQARLAVTAADPGVHDHRVAGLAVGDARPDRGDLSRDVAAEGVPAPAVPGVLSDAPTFKGQS